jgi:hypothetical protein
MSIRRAKQPGLIQSPNTYLKMQKEKISYNNKIYIITTYETETGYIIYFGSNTIYCVDILIRKGFNNTQQEYGTLAQLRWDSNCAIEGSIFEKGEDTVNILKLAISYINKSYPFVKYLLFNDTSTKKCDDGTSVSLSGMKYFTDGKTWYEDRLNAKIEPVYEILYNALMEKTKKIKEKMSWEEVNYIIPFTQIYTYISEEELKLLYENTSTWQDFFKSIRNKIGISNLCIWFGYKSWFDSFIENNLRFGITSIKFYFDVKEFNLEYSIKQIGGKRKTRKYNKNYFI